MTILKKGSTGQEVTRWQNFLRGYDPYSEVVASGIFDDVTFLETKSFQSSRNLSSDGIVGPTTLAEAINCGYDNVRDSNMWPSNPGIKNLSFIERQKLFGQFSYISAPVSGNPEAIKITDSWAVGNIKSVTIPQLVGVSGAPANGVIQVHKKIADQTVNLFQAWEDAGFKGRMLTWGGSWVPRFIRGSRTSLSNHSWGTAFDINAQWNGLGVKPALKGNKGSVVELVDIAVQHGFFWGGWFMNRQDGMHFEAYKVM